MYSYTTQHRDGCVNIHDYDYDIALICRKFHLWLGVGNRILSLLILFLILYFSLWIFICIIVMCYCTFTAYVCVPDVTYFLGSLFACFSNFSSNCHEILLSMVIHPFLWKPECSYYWFFQHGWNGIHVFPVYRNLRLTIPGLGLVQLIG